MARKITGWGRGNNPFTRSEYNRSHIKESFGFNYLDYLVSYAKISKDENAKRKKAIKKKPSKKRKRKHDFFSSGLNIEF